MTPEDTKLGTIPLLEAATAQIAALQDNLPITMQIEPAAAMVLIGQLQLALRHPQNTGPSSEHTRRFIAGLRGLIAQPGDPLDRLIEMGFNPEFDE